MLNRWLRTTTRFVTLFSTALVLTACGGGGGGVGSGGFLGNSGEDTLDAVIAIAATNAAGEPDNELSAANPLTVTVTLERGNGDPIPEAIVDLSASVGSVSPDNGAALTDANGVAVFEVTFDGTEGAGTLTASYTEGDQTLNVELGIQAVTVEITPAYLLELETTDSAGNPSKRFSSIDPLNVMVTLYSVDGDELTPLPDEIITLETSIGSIDPSNGSTLTDANGQAMFVLSAQSDAGAGTLLAAFEAPSGDVFNRSQNVEVQVASTEAPAYSLDLQLFDAAGNTTTQLTAEEPVTARVTLSANADTVSVGSRIVSLESTIANVSPANGSSLTDANGVAEFLLEFGGTIGAGTVTASFATDTISLIETEVLEASSVAVETGLSILLLDTNGNASNILSDDTPLTVRVSITDREGNVQDVDDAIIQLESELGDVSPANGQALTNNGVAEFTLQFDGNVGAGVVTARYTTEQGDLEQTANIEAQTDEESTYVLSLSRSGGSVTPTNPVTVTVNLRSGSANGPRVAGELVTLTSAISDVSPDNGTAVTDAAGNASFILEYNGTDGAGLVEAIYSSEAGNTFTNGINVTASRGSPLYTVRITEPVSGQDFDETGIDVTVNVATSAGIQNRALVVTLSSDVGIVTPDNGAALTDSNGNASFRLTGNGSTGAGFLTATFTDADGNTYEDVVSVTMSTSGIGGGGTDPSKITFVSATPETIALKGSGGGDGLTEQATVIFQVTDSSDTGVPGQAVSFRLSTDLGGVALQDAAGTTDANGNVVAVVNSGSLPTPVRVEARTTVPEIGEIGALSTVLNVSSGVPVNSRFVLFYSADQRECEDLLTCTYLIATGFDRFGNPAVDGTVVNFVTNCGGVGRPDAPSTGSCVLGDRDDIGFGRCEVQWVAGNLDPADGSLCLVDDANGVEQSVDIQVMAYALGEEDFTDLNGNAFFDAEPIDPVPANAPSRERELNLEAGGEPFLDFNVDGMYETGEFFVDWNGNGVRDAMTTSSDDSTARPGPYPKAMPADPAEPDDDLAPYNYLFYNGTACAERLDGDGNPEAGSPNIADPSDGAGIVADVDDCSAELIYVWDTIDPSLTPAP